MRKIILLVLVLIGIIEGCKKYPEGPKISLRSPMHRLYGAYHLCDYTVNGVDSLDLFYDSLSLTCGFYYEDYSDQNLYQNNDRRKDGKGCLLFWEWSLTNNTLKSQTS